MFRLGSIKEEGKGNSGSGGGGGGSGKPTTRAITPGEKDLLNAIQHLDSTLQKSVKEMGSSLPASASAPGSVAGLPDLPNDGTTRRRKVEAGSVISEPPSSASLSDGPKPRRRRLGTFSKNEVGRPDKVTIYVRVVFLKLGEIDTANEKFSADAFVQAKWREPTLDGESRGAEFEVLNRHEVWDPKLYVENAMGELKESIWCIVSYDLQGRATIYQRRRVKGTFFERMELNQFPFDTQDLTLTLASERGELELELNIDEGEISTVNVQSFVDEQEWVLHKHINSWKRVTTNAYKSSRHKHPAIAISCTATRRSRFFIWNIILVMMFICTLVFTTFTVDQDKPQNRLQLAFILLLSNITFKFTVNQALPKVSYLTYLDKYILISMAIQCLVCLWHAVISKVLAYVGATFAENIDKYALISLLALYIIFNFIFFAWSKCLIARRSKEYSKKDLKQKEKLKRMEADANSPHSVVPM